MLTIRLIYESLGFAWRALKSNILRTVLSLLGVTIGIFSVIAVLAIVDSLEISIRQSLSTLGSSVLYVDKFPWDGGAGGGRDWWKSYIKWPTSSNNEYQFLKANLQKNSAICIYADAGNATVKSDGSSLNQILITGASTGYDKVFDLDLAMGRYFSNIELEGGREVVMIGHGVAEKLFPNDSSPVGKYIKIKNKKFNIIGVLKKKGQNLFGGEEDYRCIIPYDAMRKIYQTGTGKWSEFQTRSIIGLKGYPNDLGLVELENEIRGFMRVKRGLKPIEKDNFIINRPEGIMKALSPIFNILTIAGWIIGGFAMLVGGFGIANIMFVSVKERTSIIGLQKSLGAKNYFILFQFLFESVFLSLIGGLFGLSLVFLTTQASLGDLELVLSVSNIVLGLSVSSIIGLVAGIVPAAMAARLDPVAAMRAN